MTRAGQRAKHVGRADLLRALVRGPSDADASVIGECLGFERQPDAEESQPLPPRGRPEPDEAAFDREPAPAQRPRRGPVRLWNVVEVIPRESLDGVPPQRPIPRPSRPLSKDDFRPVVEVGPSSPSLVPWTSLRRVMEEVCRRDRPIGDVDVDAVVDRLSQVVPLHRIPRSPRPVRPPRIVVVVDRSARLIPFWEDQREVFDRLRSELGSEGITRRRWTDGPPLAVADDVLVRAVDSQLEVGDVVLVLGDLGHYAAARPHERLSATARAYAQLGRALRGHGVTAAALLPVPASRWEPEVVRHWRVIDWAEPTRRASPAGPPDLVELARRRDRLLTLVSWTQRLEPGLLREARLCLSPDEADVGTEADAWCYQPPPKSKTHDGRGEAEGESRGAVDQIVYQHIAGLVLPDAVRRSWHPALRSLLKAHGALVRRVVGRVRRYHAAYAREIWLDEVRGLASLDETEAVVTSGKDEGITLEERAEAYDFTLKVRTYIDRRDDGRDPLRGVDLEGWLATFLDGQPEQVWRQGEWGELLGETWVMLGLDGHAVPPGLDLSRLPRLAEGVEERRFVVAQRCDRLSVGVEGGDVAQRGSPLVTVAANARWITIGGRHHALDEVRVLDLPLPPGDELELSTDRVERVRLRLETKPGWARELVRDRTGLHVMPLRWAAAHGEDEFGLWATFRVGEVEQRMRWIASRQSVMGSPPTEQGRDDDEGPQHEVVLTEGYWLADTPCTQALWTAVMGSNPSAYQSSRHPVEQVSWDEVQEFCVALNERVQGLEAGLPTEAQWEHACRAGTTAATYAGDLDILGENNAPGLDEIAWYGGNSGVGYELEKGGGSSGWPNKQYPHTKARTREVASKRPNPWGLYDMLGNVWEWCTDMRRDYRSSRVVDPVGPPGPGRVIRGGSWRSDARLVRAAFRLWLEPGDRGDDLGFRISQGQGLRQPDQPDQPAASDEQEREAREGTDRRPPGGRRR